MAGSRHYGKTLEGDAGGGGSRGIGLAAEFGGEGAFNVGFVRGVGWRGPVELDLIADALGGEVGDDLGEVERGRVGNAWAGAADGEG